MQHKFRKCRLNPTFSEACLSKIEVELSHEPVIKIEEEHEDYNFRIGRPQGLYTNSEDNWI